MADYPHPLEKRFRRIMDGSLRRSVRLGRLGLAAVLVMAAILLPGARGANDAGNDVASEAEGEAAEEINEPAQADKTTSTETSWLGKPQKIAGRVVDESNMAVAGAKLWLPVQWTPEGPLVAKATADDRGRFRSTSPATDDGTPRLQLFHDDLAYAPKHRIAIGNAARDCSGRRRAGEIVLRSATKTSVRVFKPDGTPAVGATVGPYHFRGTRGYEIMPEELVAISQDDNRHERLAAFRRFRSTDSTISTSRHKVSDANAPDGSRPG